MDTQNMNLGGYCPVCLKVKCKCEPKLVVTDKDNRSMIKQGLPQGQDVGLYELTATYVQQRDTNDGETDDLQELKITAECVGGDFYYVLKTERWAFDNTVEMRKVMDDFVSRLKYYQKDASE